MKNTATKNIELTAKFIRQKNIVFGDGTENRTITALVESAVDIDGWMLSETMTVKGKCQPGELQTGLTYRFFGYWKDTPKYGLQFEFSSFCEHVPPMKTGVISYLQRCVGIGTARAEKIWNTFGEKSIEAVKNSDLRLFEIKGLTQEIIAEAAVRLRNLEATEAVTVELHGLLDGSGIPKYVRTAVVKEYGTEAARVIRENPFCLMKYSGVSFPLADKLYQNIGLPLAAPDRQGWCLWNLVYRDRSGSVWLDRKKLKLKFTKEIGMGADFDTALQFGNERGFYSYRDGFLAEVNAAEAEKRVAENIDRLYRDRDVLWSDLDFSDDLTEHQIEEVQKATARKIGILSGGPGTGKTFTLARLVGAVGAENCIVCAPTGKAAVRITQTLKSYGIELTAQTIHSTLGCIPTDKGFSFQHNAADPLDADYVIVDEASMLSTELIDVLLQAIGQDTHLLLVGDPDQLPPVGVGAPLRDMIVAGIPNGHLTEIIRNQGNIVAACHKIRMKQRFDVASQKLATPEENLVNIHRMTSVEKTLGTIVDNRSVNDVQLIVAVNKKTKYCLENINRSAKSIFNTPYSQKEGEPPRIDVGDKVICGKNGSVLLADPPKGKSEFHFIANGDMGIVLDRGLDGALIQLDTAIVKIPFAEESRISMSDFSLGYAITAHRSQGSEWPIVVIFLDGSFNAKSICDCHWLYTAVSRAKQECYIIGDMKVAFDMIRRSKMWERKTFLVELLKHLQWREFSEAWDNELELSK